MVNKGRTRPVRWLVGIVIGLSALAAALLLWVFPPFQAGEMVVTLTDDSVAAHHPDQTPTEDVQPWVVVIQLEISPQVYASRDSFRAWLCDPLEQGLEQIPPGAPVLAAYPELCGIGLLFLDDPDILARATSFEKAITAMATKHPVGLLRQVARHRVSPVRALMLERAPAAASVYLKTFSELAAGKGITIAAGSMLMPRCDPAQQGERVVVHRAGPDLYNAACLFGPDGRLLTWQPKVYLTDMEGADGLDLCAGTLTHVTPAVTTVGSVGLAVCADAFHDDLLQKLVEQDAEILIQPSANPGVWSTNQQKEWLMSARQAANSYPSLRCVLNPMMTGSLLDVTFEGQSAIAVHQQRSPKPMNYLNLKPIAGFAAVATQATGSEVLVTPVPVSQQANESARSDGHADRQGRASQTD